MDDFYKQIKDSLTGQPEPSFRKGDWNALSREMRSRKLSPVAFWTWLILPLLLSLGSLGYYYFDGNDFHQAHGLLERRDTVYITETKILRDTIFMKNGQTVDYKVARIPIEERTKIRQMQSEIIALKQQLVDLEYLKLSTGPVGIDAPLVTDGSPNGMDDPRVQNNWTDYPATAIDHRIYASVETSFLTSLPLKRPSDVLKPGNRNSLWGDVVEEFSEIKIHPMQVGVGTGLFYPAFGQGEFHIGKMAGIQAVMPVTPHFQVESNLSYQQSAYETEDLTEIGGFLPVSPAENERFLKVEAPFKTLQWDLGLNYAFNTKGKLQPKLGLGYGIIFFYQNELSFEYENLDTGIVYAVEDGGKSQGLQANSWLIRTGADYHLGADWALALNGQYRTTNGSEQYQTPSYWSFGLGLRYKF